MNNNNFVIMKNIFFQEMTYKERASLAINPMGKQLLEIMEQKQTNLAVSVDFTTSTEILHVSFERFFRSVKLSGLGFPSFT